MATIPPGVNVRDDTVRIANQPACDGVTLGAGTPPPISVLNGVAAPNNVLINGAPALPAIYGRFFALMPGDNPAPLATYPAAGSIVALSQPALLTAGITFNAGTSTVTLAAIGTYRLQWSAALTAPGQMGLIGVDNAVEGIIPTSVISGTTLANATIVVTSAANATIRLANIGAPATLATAAPTPNAATLVVERIA